MSLDIYVPRDEQFGHVKLADFLTYALKSLVLFLFPEFKSLSDSSPNEFDSFQDVLNLYEGGIKLPQGPLLKAITDNIPIEMLREIFRSDGEGLFKFPTPQEFPPKSKLDPNVYGDHTSKITKENIQGRLDGLSVEEAIKNNQLFILNHHDMLMPYLRRINSTSNKIYASRTLLFLQTDGTLKPIAIELSLPSSLGDKFGAESKVYTPAEQGVENGVWELAKAYVAVNDSGVHQLVSHWLNTHAVIEPFVIATNRQLSAFHPLYKLLHPHFRDTMSINALARQILINGGGILEKTVFPDRYAMEMSAVVYKDWVFTDQALPIDLVKRGLAVEDKNSPHGVRLLIEDYPYAVDGLEIWSSIKTWVDDYCKFYYKSDDMVLKDTELQTMSLLIPVSAHFGAQYSVCSDIREAIKNIEKKLSPGQLQQFRKTPIGHFMGIKNLQFSGQIIHQMLLLLVEGTAEHEPQDNMFEVDSHMVEVDDKEDDDLDEDKLLMELTLNKEKLLGKGKPVINEPLQKRKRQKSKYYCSPFTDPRPRKIARPNVNPFTIEIIAEDWNSLESWIHEADNVSPTTIELHSKGVGHVNRDFFRDLIDQEKWLSNDHLEAIMDNMLEVLNGIERKNYTAVGPVFVNHLLRMSADECVWSNDKFLREFDWSGVEKIFLPVNGDGRHWLLAEIDLLRNQVRVYDSLKGPKSSFYVKEVVRRIPPLLHTVKGVGANTLEKEWETFVVNGIPQQDSRYGNCGVMVLAYLEYLLVGLPLSPDCSSEHMPDFRCQFAARLWRGRKTTNI
ncbi:unnamed protein product [Cuscuta campestris]|uniref:Lipoxygenase n=1 Tax=Cuscuta campestris TaxID=132261 RepID=A0A484NBD9_9ASTE|nr:unnamed protein product [Cuscuta campestris]